MVAGQVMCTPIKEAGWKNVSGVGVPGGGGGKGRCTKVLR